MGGARPGLAQTVILTSITISAPRTSLFVGETVQFTALGTYSDGSTADITLSAIWSVAGVSGVVTISDTGLVTAIGDGSTRVLAQMARPALPFVNSNFVTLTVLKRCTQDPDCSDSNLCTRDTCDPSTLTCRHDSVVDCSASKGACYQPGVCLPSTGQCVYVPLADGDACSPNPSDPSCAFYSCQDLVCTRQCGAYLFSGFFPHVQNSPVLNGAKAGSAIPIKFKLNGDQGLNVLAEGYPTSQRVTCANVGTLLDMPSEAVSPGASTLSYDPATGQYSYVWKTDKSWAGTCRQFVLRLRDGSIHIPYFQFK